MKEHEHKNPKIPTGSDLLGAIKAKATAKGQEKVSRSKLIDGGSFSLFDSGTVKKIGGFEGVVFGKIQTPIVNEEGMRTGTETVFLVKDPKAEGGVGVQRYTSSEDYNQGTMYAYMGVLASHITGKGIGDSEAHLNAGLERIERRDQNAYLQQQEAGTINPSADDMQRYLMELAAV